jgi:hypothetical protein
MMTLNLLLRRYEKSRINALLSALEMSSIVTPSSSEIYRERSISITLGVPYLALSLAGSEPYSAVIDGRLMSGLSAL